MPGTDITTRRRILAEAQEAQEAYDAKNYQKSIKLLSTVNNAFDNALRTKALVLRIAAHVKLTEYDQALDDAKLLIRHDRTNAQGYIRCGQIECLRRRYDAASIWYQHGLRRAAASDPLRSVLETQLARAQSQAADDRALKACDLMTCLPLEIVDMLLAYFDYRDHIALLRVSREWKRLLLHRPPLATELDFTRASRTVPTKAFGAATSRLQRCPSKVALANLDSRATKSARYYLRSWLSSSYLQNLELYGSDLVHVLHEFSFCSASIRYLKLGADTHTTTRDAIEFLTACPQLREACFLDVVEDARHYASVEIEIELPLLETLTFIAKASLGFPGNGPKLTTGFFASMINLQTLKVHNVQPPGQGLGLDLSLHEQLRHIELISLEAPLILPPSVITLNLQDSNLDLDGPQELGELRTLNICKTRFRTNIQIQALLLTAPRLENLTITLGDTSYYGKEWRDYQLKSFTTIRKLRVYCQDLGDQDVPLFDEWFPRVESMVLECAEITGYFVAKMIKSRPRLQNLLLQDCRSVSADTVEWAQSRGVKMTMSRTRH